MKQSQKIILYTETLSTAKTVIPAPYPVRGKLQRESRLPPAQRERTGFPRIKYGTSLVKPGMTIEVNPVRKSSTFQRGGSHEALNPVFALKGIKSSSPLQAAGLSNGVKGLLRQYSRI